MSAPLNVKFGDFVRVVRIVAIGGDCDTYHHYSHCKIISILLLRSMVFYAFGKIGAETAQIVTEIRDDI